MFKRFPVVIAACSTFFLGQGAAQAQISVRQISSDAFLSDSLVPQLNDAGQVAYWAFSSQKFDSGELLEWSKGVTTRVIGLGDQAPGLPTGTTFGSSDYELPQFLLNNRGEVAVCGDYANYSTGTDGQAIWGGKTGTLKLILQTSEPAPDYPGKVYLRFRLYGFDSAGDVLVCDPVYADPSGKNQVDDSAFWLISSSGAQRVVGVGDGAPGTGGREFTYLPYYVPFPVYNNLISPAFSSQGIIGFGAGFTDQDMYGPGGIWEWTSDGTIRPIVQDGDTAIGLPSGVTLLPSETLQMSSNGNVAFDAALAGPETANQDLAICAYINGSVHAFARYGDAVPDFAPFIFSNHLDNVQVNDSGVVALVTGITHPGVNTEPGLFRWNNDQIKLLAWYGEYAPGFNKDWLLGGFDQMFISDAGQILFTTDLMPYDISGSAIPSLWMIGDDDQPHLLLEAGIPVDIGGKMITLRSIDLLALNNSGQALISDPLAGGLYLITPAPEPAGSLLLPLIAEFAFQRRRGRRRS